MFKKLFYLCLLFVCSIFLINAKPKNRLVKFSASDVQYDDTRQNDKSFYLSEVQQDPSHTVDPTTLQKYLVVGRWDPGSSIGHYIQLVQVPDPTDSTKWNENTPAAVLDTQGNIIWGWTADEMTGVIYTLEQNGQKRADASIHAYWIQSGKFVKKDLLENYFISFTPDTIGFSWSLKSGSGAALPSVGMAFINGHLFFADGGTIISAETNLHTRFDIPGYVWPFKDKWIKTLTKVGSPMSGDMLVGAGPMGNIVVMTFDPQSEKFTLITPSDRVIWTVAYQYPTNFKVIPIQLKSSTEYRTYYSLTFVAESANAPMRRVYYIPLTVTDKNEIAWDRIGPIASTPLPDETTNSAYHVIHTLVTKEQPQQSFTDTPANEAKILGSQYITTLYYRNKYGRGNDLIYGKSQFSAYFTSTNGISNDQIRKAQNAPQVRKVTDNIIGVIYGVPPLYDPSIISSTNKVNYGWSSEHEDSSTVGFAMDTSLKVGLDVKQDDWLYSFESETTFGIYGGYKKQKRSVAKTFLDLDQTISSTPNKPDPAWDYNSGWFITESGYSSYIAYRLVAADINNNPADIVGVNRNNPFSDDDLPHIAVMTLVPESTSLNTDLIRFRLTDGVIKGSMQEDPVGYDKRFDWTGYLDGVQIPKDKSVYSSTDLTTTQLYWNKNDGSTAAINAEFNNNHVSKYDSNTLQVGASGAGTETKVSFEHSTTAATSNEGYFKTSFEQKTSGSIYGYGGSYDFEFSLEYNHETESLTTKTQKWGATTTTEAQSLLGSASSTPILAVTMYLLQPTNDTKQKPFWIPQWAWDKGNKPWLITWTARSGSDSLATTKSKMKKKPSSTPAKL